MLFTVTGTQTVAAKSILGVVATAAVRPRVAKFTISNIGLVSTDSGIEVHLKRFTAAGTSTGVTPAGGDSGDPAATLTAGSNHSAEPTYTANTLLKQLSTNPRGQGGWTAYDKDAEFVAPATAANGFGWLLNALGGGVTVVVDAEIRQ